MPRQSNGWGDCVNCGEILKPEDEDRYADRCPFCLRLTKVFQLVNDRILYAEKNIRYAETEEFSNYWTTRLETYKAIHERLREALKLKKDELWGESY